MSKKNTKEVEYNMGMYVRPETVEYGTIEKGSGQTVISGPTYKLLNRRGTIAIPNRTEAWGVRLDRNGNVPRPEEKLQANSPNYGGQVKFLKWGEEGGEIIVCRYLKGYNSLDMHYQDLVLGAANRFREDSEEAADAAYLIFQTGDNYFDTSKDSYLIQLLDVHYMNRDSESRDPNIDIVTHMYYKVKPGVAIDAPSGDMLYYKKVALNLVSDNSGSNETLLTLFEIVKPIVSDNSGGSDPYRTLNFYADQNPAIFIEQVNRYKMFADDVIEKAKSYEVLDISKDGTILAGITGKKKLIADNIPGKKEEMLKWIADNFTDPRAYVAIQKLKEITDKLN